MGIAEEQLIEIRKRMLQMKLHNNFEKAVACARTRSCISMKIMYLFQHLLRKKKENAHPAGKEKIMMVDAALFAIREIMEEHPEAVIIWTGCGKKIGWCIS